jgi:hypothetical protein
VGVTWSPNVTLRWDKLGIEIGINCPKVYRDDRIPRYRRYNDVTGKI